MSSPPCELRAWYNRAIFRWLQQACFPTSFDKILAIPGWSAESQLRYLMSCVSSLPDHSHIVEIGVWQGRSAIAMAEACRGTGKRVFAIDPWQDYTQEGVQVSRYVNGWGVNSFEAVFTTFQRNIQRFRLEPWIVTCRSTSRAAAETWSHGPVGMVYIDGNHDEEAVRTDLEAWVPLVGKGGIVCGDDWSWESVHRAVKGFLSNHTGFHLALPCANLWLFRV